MQFFRSKSYDLEGRSLFYSVEEDGFFQIKFLFHNTFFANVWFQTLEKCGSCIIIEIDICWLHCTEHRSRIRYAITRFAVQCRSAVVVGVHKSLTLHK